MGFVFTTAFPLESIFHTLEKKAVQNQKKNLQPEEFFIQVTPGVMVSGECFTLEIGETPSVRSIRVGILVETHSAVLVQQLQFLLVERH